jgi:acyl-CoA dehydrogenase
VTANANDLEDLRLRTRHFVRETVIPAEPRPGTGLHAATREQLQTAAKDAGVFAPHAAMEFGGLGLPIDQWSPIFQEAGYSPIGPTALNCMAPDEGDMHLMEIVATPLQKEKYLTPLVAGTVRSCFAMTEPHPGAGSDPGALTTRAVRVEGGWTITGEKRFISGADGAAFGIVMAQTPEANGAPEGATMFLFDLDGPGIRLGRHIPTIDRAIDGGHHHLYFEGAFVPDDAVLGEVGLGFRYAQVRLGPARLTHCMRWLGLARRALDIALDRADRREIFGSRLGDLGLAQELIAMSVIDIETSDAIIAKTADLLVRDPKAGSAMSSVAKVHCADAISRVIDRAMQLCGGDGVSNQLPLASFANEVRPFRIYDGSTETHKWAMARRAVSERRRAREGGEPRRDELLPLDGVEL